MPVQGALPEPSFNGGTRPLTTTPVVGRPPRQYPEQYVPGTEDLAAGEIRVTMLGTGDPFLKRSQACTSVLVEIGNPEKDFLFFDLGSGALANFSSMALPLESATKVFLSHLHADHIGDLPGLLASFVNIGRRDQVEVWGGGSEDPELGLAAFVRSMNKALGWHAASGLGVAPQRSFEAIAHELPYDRPETVFEGGGVTISSFPAIHGLSGAVGYALEYAGCKVVFTGDTLPCRYVVEAAAGADLLLHESFQAPSIAAKAMGLDPEYAAARLKAAHTIPSQLGRIFEMARPRVGAFFHMDLSPGVDAAVADIRESFDGPVVATQDFTVFNVTAEAVVTRQTRIEDAPHAVHGPSKSHAEPEPAPTPPRWWADATLDL